MTVKTYQVGFYTAQLGPLASTINLHDTLIQYCPGRSGPVATVAGFDYKIKDLTHTGNTIRGVFAKFRHTDIPRIGSVADDNESDITLADNQGLIEKNHFIYYSDINLIVFQHCREASTIQRFAYYFTEVTSTTAAFHPVLKGDSINRILHGGMRPKKMELSFALPRGSILQGNSQFNNQIMQILSGSGGNTMHITVSVGRKKSAYLNMNIKDAVVEMLENANPSVAKITAHDEDDSVHNIDLIADRIRDTITVTMNGRYPVSEEVFRELHQCKVNRRDEIQEVLGT